MEGQEYVLIAELERKGETVREKFQEPELLSLYHIIANLCGRIRFLRDPDESQRWSHLVRQPAKVDSPMQRMIHHEDAETVFG